MSICRFEITPGIGCTIPRSSGTAFGSAVCRAALVAGWWLFVPALPASAEPPRPNVLVIVSDNQGWMDIGYHGSAVRTPHLDRLAGQGVRLDNFYVFPMCSPTRAGLMSGRNPSRFGIVGAIGHRSLQALPPDTMTIADAFESAGYETALVGKWHLGLRPEVGPLRYGFDSSYGYLHGQIDKYRHLYKNGDRTWHRNDTFIHEEGHVTDLLTAEAVRFVRQSRDRPFFLYLSYGAPHPPLQEPDEWVKPYKDTIDEPSRQLYAASITHMDDGVGQVVAALDESGLRDKTLIVFLSDNGAYPDQEPSTDYDGRFGPYELLGDNGELRGWLGDVYDGSLRTPAFLHWQGRLKPRVEDAVVSVLDLFPTLARLAGCRVPDEVQLEGIDVWPVVEGGRAASPRDLYWRTPSQSAVRSGPWKLVVDHRGGDAELYRMDRDPIERHDVATEHPEKVAELRQIYECQRSRDPS